MCVFKYKYTSQLLGPEVSYALGIADGGFYYNYVRDLIKHTTNV